MTISIHSRLKLCLSSILSGTLGIALILATFCSAGAAFAQTLSNDRFTVRVHGPSNIDVISFDGSLTTLEMRFLVQQAKVDPFLNMKQANFPGKSIEYNVSTWHLGEDHSKEHEVKKVLGHVADGYDPNADAALPSDRTADVYAAAPGITLIPQAVHAAGDRIEWTYPVESDFQLKAYMDLSKGDADPSISFELTVYSSMWYSVAFIGAPAISYVDVQSLWQPLLWQERRLPDKPYLTEAFRCPLPSTFVQSSDVTRGILAAPEELPFDPMPTWKNSRFGVVLRTQQGKARSTLFSPILGGPGSFMKKDSSYRFHMLWVQRKKSIFETYKEMATDVYGVSDYRENAHTNLNHTFENMIDYAMGPFARFNDDLRGSAYDTDVPGSVKNISALHPLSIAIVTDDQDIWTKRARPMIEYGLSRERFLFSISSNVKGQGASSRLAGPGVPLSELTALYSMSGKRNPFLLEQAKALLDKPRSLNLDTPTRIGWWGDDLALYRATGDRHWLDKAISMADRYLKSRVETPQSDFSDPGSDGMFFWTSFVPRWIELYELWQITHQKRYLNAAHKGADAFTEFIWMSPHIPDTSLLVNRGGLAPLYRTGKEYTPIHVPEEMVPAWRLSEIGLTPEAAGTSKGHRGIFLTTFAPFFLKLSGETDDSFLQMLGRDAVVGRYASFPGYHMNTARTTVYEKPDFPLRSLSVLNSTTSLHYNHIWPQIAMIADYLVSDAELRSRGAIHFPSQFAEGYGYVSTEVYGDRPGSFFADKGVWLWMPKHLAEPKNIQLNYIAARGTASVYFAFTNQSDKEVSTTVHLDAARLNLNGEMHPIRIWTQNGRESRSRMVGSAIQVTVPAHGLTSVAIDRMKLSPRFQNSFAPHVSSRSVWKRNYVSLQPAGLHAMVLDMGPKWRSIYLYLQAATEQVKDVVLEYSTSNKWVSVSDASFPFEFTIPLSSQENKFRFRAFVHMRDGSTVKLEDELRQ